MAPPTNDTSPTSRRIKAAVIGSGNIGTDLMIKSARTSDVVDIIAMVGIDPESDGLARAARMGLDTTAGGIDAMVSMDSFDEVELVFDATSAGAHHRHDEVLQAAGKQILDLTPAAIGPYCVPSVNLDQHIGASNLNMVTCGGQATVPIVAAVNNVSPVVYAEIVSSISSRSAGPGTRANIDEFTETTAAALERVGGAMLGKAIIVLNPAEPPLIMRNTVFTLVESGAPEAIEASIHEMVATVQEYVPGYRLKQAVQFERLDEGAPVRIPDLDRKFTGWKASVFLEVEGAAHYLPAYAGNLDIMTSAAIRTAERLALRSEEAAR
ncbi:MAG: acetaldehyde dehydrogenase (acetylating) [Ilumatobacter sp.]|uniref:acetaldehyde dehydrogenase (acetylating) n=1 Tax=Ilumatobacter sp. TaxID=1967498 RepID=UPI00391B40F7